MRRYFRTAGVCRWCAYVFFFSCFVCKCVNYLLKSSVKRFLTHVSSHFQSAAKFPLVRSAIRVVKIETVVESVCVCLCVCVCVLKLV